MLARSGARVNPLRMTFIPAALAVVALTLGLLVQVFIHASALPTIAGQSSLSAAGQPQASRAASAASELSRVPLAFEANVGQASADVRYMVRATGATVYFLQSGVAMALPNAGAGFPAKTREGTQAPVVHMSFVGADPNATIAGGQQLPGKVNYYIGSNPADWHTNLPTYSGLTYSNLYPGVSLAYEGAGGQLKGTYQLAAGANAAAVEWRYAGADKVSLAASGNLQITVGRSTVEEQAPVAWQEINGSRVPVSARYSITQDGAVTFALGSYNSAYPLTIDPTLSFSTFLGGGSDETARGVTLDSQGYVYVTGTTDSNNFPVANQIYTYVGAYDIFVSKLSPDGTQLLYSTYIGGTNTEDARDIALDPSGNIYITGYSDSTDYPLLNAYQTTGTGCGAQILTKLNATGALAYSTYLHGTGCNSTAGGGVAADAAGHAFILGYTGSSDFPTRNAFQATYGGGSRDMTVAEFDTQASGDASLLYSTFLGGSGVEYLGSYNDQAGAGLALDAQNNVYITGETTSQDFPTRNAYQPNNGGGQNSGYTDAFVAKLSPSVPGDGSLVYSTYLGGDADEHGRDIAVDSAGAAYVTGAIGVYGRGNTFPTTQGAYHSCSNNMVFVTKLNPGGTTLGYSTCVGAATPVNIALDSQNNAYVTGSTRDAAFPMVDPIQGTFLGFTDAIVFKLDTTGSNLLFSSYLTGSHGPNGTSASSAGWGITVDGANPPNAYVVGGTNSDDFATTQGAYQTTFGGGNSDAFVTKIFFPAPAPTATPIPPTPTPTCQTTYIDVPPGSTFYSYIECLACRGIISGYPNGTFRPNNDVTRGQLSKIIANAAGFIENHTEQTFQDVPTTNTFYQYIQRMASRNIIQGYPCGGPNEPCGPGNLPYFRPNANATRGQISKIDVLAAQQVLGWQLVNPPTNTFQDVHVGSTFYQYVETAVAHEVLNGYPCGSPPAGPCVAPDNKPYFLPNNNTTRGQISKIVSNSFFPACQTAQPEK